MTDKSMTATLKYAQTSYKKMELVAKMFRWKDVQYALETLRFMPKKAWAILYKVIHSAMSNVKNSWKMTDSLYIDTINVWRWQKIKRMRFVGRSRMHWYIKHRAFVKVVLNDM